MSDSKSPNKIPPQFLQNVDGGLEVKAVSSPENQSMKKQTSSYVSLLSALLEEPEVHGVQRLVDIFGLEVVTQKVEEALQLYKAAQATGAEAYQEANTAVATGKFKPRSRGGVFFFLMRKHCLSLGLNWAGLKISPSWYDHKDRKQASHLNQVNTPRQVSFPANEEPSPANNVVQAHDTFEQAEMPVVSSVPVVNRSDDTLHNKRSVDAQKSVKSTEGGLPVQELSTKPSRVKATLLGSLSGNPKLNPQGKEGLLELTFKAEMGNSLPKGLPNMGESKVVVWCTRKQFDKISQQITITSQTRFLIEGEPMPAVGADFSPFLRILCTRLSTVELEQRRKAE